MSDIAVWHTHRDITASKMALNNELRILNYLSTLAKATSVYSLQTEALLNIDVKINDSHIKRIDFLFYLSILRILNFASQGTSNTFVTKL